MLTDIKWTGMVEIPKLEQTDMSKIGISVPTYLLCRIVFTVPCMCRGSQTESSASGMNMPDKEEVAISADGQGICLVPPNPGHGGMLQVDDVICLHHTADQGGTVEQCTGMTGVSCPGQREPWRLFRAGVMDWHTLAPNEKQINHLTILEAKCNIFL